MTEENQVLDAMLPPPYRRRIGVTAFCVTVVLAPLMFAVSGIILMGYGIVFTGFAALLGLPAYLAIGVPAAWLVLSRYTDGTRFGDLSALALVGAFANAGSFVGGYLWARYAYGSAEEALEFAQFYAGLGLIAGPIQAVTFGLIYRSFARRVPNHPSLTKQGETPCV